MPADIHTQDGYSKLISSWRAVFAMPVSVEERQEKCLALLRTHITEMAFLSGNCRNPTLRFFLAMLQLKNDLFPFGANDDYGRLVIWPAYRLVADWVQSKWQSSGLSPEKILEHRISLFPKDYELTAFFDAEPEILNPRTDWFHDTYPGVVPWYYKTLIFKVVRGGVEVRCEISPSFGQLVLHLKSDNQYILNADVRLIDGIRLENRTDREILSASSHISNDFVLQLKPNVQVAWGVGANRGLDLGTVDG